MFENWISDLLASSLGHFIDVQRDKLRFSLWNGVVINNASIRADAFDYLDLPFKVCHGSIGQLQLQVPWRSLALGSSPIVVELSDVRLIAAPREESEWCQPAAMKRATAAKQAQLAAAELAALPEKVSSSGYTDQANSKWNFMSHIWGALLRRLQLTVQNVDISFEYKTALGHGGFTLGLQVNKLEMSKECDANQYIHEQAEPMNGDIEKSLTLSGVGVYWNIHSASSEDHDSRQFVLYPVECCFSILFQTTHPYPTQSVQFKVRGRIDKATIRTSNLQLAQMIHFADLIDIWIKRREYGKFRPQGWLDDRKGDADYVQTSWRTVWQYAIKSVLQDLHNLQPGFSFARLRLWQQWRRKYVYLYRRQMESRKMEGAADYCSPAEELRDLEAELPVAVVMLFRSIAEQTASTKEDMAGDSPGHELAPSTWFGWGMSGIWGFLGYSSSSSSTHQIPELPSEEQLSELYKALDFQPSASMERKEHQRILSFEVKLASLKASLWQQHEQTENQDQVLSMELVGSTLCADLNEDGCTSIITSENIVVVDECSNLCLGQTILEKMHDTKKEVVESNSFLRVSFSSGNSQNGGSVDPHLSCWIAPLNLTLMPSLPKRLKKVAKSFPSSTLSTWIARSITCLTSRRARTLAKAQHLTFSQSKLKIDVEIQNVRVNMPQHSPGEMAGRMVMDFELINLVSSPVRDMWDYVRVLRQIEQQHPLDEEGGRFVLQGGSESILFDDLERKLLYRQWEVTVRSLLMSTVADNSNPDQAEQFMDKVSGSGSVLVNRMSAEHSAPIVLCDWRLSPVKLKASGSQINILRSLLQAPTNTAHVDSADSGSSNLACADLSPRGKVEHLGTCVVDEGLHVESVMPLPCQSSSDYEVSISTPEMEVHIDDQDCNNTYGIGGNLPYSCLASSKTVHIAVAYQRAEAKCDVNLAKLNLQDTGNYGGRPIVARSALPRLARNIYSEEVVISLRKANGDMGLHVELNGVEGTAYPGEIAGYLKPSMPLVRATGKFSYEKCAAHNSSKIVIDLSNACFGSAFIMRIVQYCIGGDEEAQPSDFPTKKEGSHLESELEPDTFKLVGSEQGKSVAVSFVIKDCHAVVPKGAQHMAAVLGIPGGHCGVLLRVPDFALHGAYLQGLNGDEVQWSLFEVGRIYGNELAILVSRGSHNCLMTPVVEVDTISLKSSGTYYSGEEFPLVWNSKLRTINSEMNVAGPQISMDVSRLEVVACSLSDLLVKMDQLSGSHPGEKHPERTATRAQLGDRVSSKCCVPLRKVGLTLSVSAVKLSYIRPSVELSDAPSDPLCTFLEWSGLQVLYSTGYGSGNLPERTTAQSPFQMGSKAHDASDTSLDTPQPSIAGLPQDTRNVSNEMNVSWQRLYAAWGELILYERKVAYDLQAHFYFLTPDGRILQYSRPDERELIAGELGDSTLAVSLWAPVKMDGEDDDLSGSLSSTGSFETAGSNFSIGRKTSITSTGDFCSIEEGKLVSESPRSTSAQSDLLEIDEYFSELAQASKKSNCGPSSPVAEGISEPELLMRLSASDSCEDCVVTFSERIVSNRSKDISVVCPRIEIDVNICPWAGTLDAGIEAARVVKQYSSTNERKDKKRCSSRLESLVSISISAFKFTVVCIGQNAGIASESTVFYPALIVNANSMAGSFDNAVEMSVSDVGLSSCWVTSASPPSMSWEVYKETRKLIHLNKISLKGSLKPSDHSSMVDVAFNLSMDTVKIWFSHHRSVPFLLVMTWANTIWLQLRLDRPEASDNRRDSTSAPSSLLNFIQQYGVGPERRTALFKLFGKLMCHFGSISLRLSDDRSQIDFPLLDSKIENVSMEAKREVSSSLFVWGMELCLRLSIYNRQKMGWEALVEPWSLKVSAESRLCRSTIHQSAQSDVGFHTLLRCISDQPVQLTLSNGMLETVGVIQELLSVASKLSPESMPVAPDHVNPENQISKFFTTHWLHNKTGVAMHFWTTRETIGSQTSSQAPSLHASPEIVDNAGIPLRAVVVSDKQDTNSIGTRQMSLSELNLYRNSQGDPLDFHGTTMLSERNDGVRSTSCGSIDLGLRNEKLPSVGEDGVQDLLPEPTQKLPVDHAVVSHGFEVETNPRLGCETASFSRHRHMRLYFRLDNQEIACGPVTLDTVGTKLHTVRISDNPSKAKIAEKVWTKAEVVCDVTQRSTGGFDVSVHSNAKITNQTSITLEIGCYGPKQKVDPLVLIVDAGDSAWLPITTTSYGIMRLRPHPESNDPWAMRSAWSAPVHLPQLFQELATSSPVFCHLKCSPVSGGLKPVWLNVGAVKNWGDCFANIQIQSPVIVRNFLPVPSDVELRCQKGIMLGLRGSIYPRCSIQGHTLQGGRVDSIAVMPKGYKLARVDHSPQVEAGGLPASEGDLGMLRPSGEDTRLADSMVKLECEGAGSISICISHSVEGFTGRHTFEILCALWVYNCTGLPVAVREYQDFEPFVDEEAVRVPDDKVPNRWVPPFVDMTMHEELGELSRQEWSSNRRRSSSLKPLPSLGEMGGLKDLLLSGDPVKFKIRSSWSGDQNRSNQKSSKTRRTSGAEWPWMEVDGPPRQGRLRLQIRASRAQAPKGSDYWSSPLSVDSFGGAAIVQAPCPINSAAGRQSFPNAAYYFAITSHLIPRTAGAWSLHVMPRYILVNHTSVPLQYRQQSVPIEHNLLVDACKCIQWPDARRPLRLNLRIKESGWLWSGGISLESPGDMFVKVRHRHREETMLLQVDVSMSRSGVLMGRLSHQTDGFAPYRLDNCTNEKFHVRQEGCREQEDVLRPYSSIPYAWDEPAGIHKVVLELSGHRLVGTLKLDQVGSAVKVALRPDPSSPYTNRRRRLHILVVAEGPTRVMVVMDEDIHPGTVGGPFNRSSSNEQLGWHSWSSPQVVQSSKNGRTTEVRAGFEVEAHLSGVGISFVTAYKELLYAWICEPQLCLAVGKVRYRLECAVSRFQLDNCIRDAVYPVLFRGPASVHARRHSAMTMRASIWRRRPGGVVCVEQLHLDFAPLALEIEESHMGDVLFFFDNHIKTLVNPPESTREQHQPDVVILEDGRAWSQIVPKAKVYIESLMISKTDLTFSFCPASWRLSGSENLQKWIGPSNLLLQRFLAFADVEAAHIHIKGLELQHPLLSQSALFALVGRHYMRGLVHEVYKIVGSADILGDPVRLVHHLGLGVWSLFSNPASAALEETSSKFEIPQRVLVGFMVGLRSLLSNTIYAFSNATAKLSLTARKGLVLLRLEDEGMLRNSRRGMTRNARLSLTKSMDSGLVEAIMDGVGGLLSEPVRGVKEAGLVGLVRGIMRGSIGLLVGPTARALEMSSRMADSIQAFVSGYQGPLPLMRVPRMVDPSSPLQLYDGLDAVGALVLAEANDGIFQNDILLSCWEAPSKGRFIVVTHRHLLVVSMRDPNSPYSFPKVSVGISLDEVENVNIKQGVVRLLGIPVRIEMEARSPFVWWEVECGASFAARIASHVLYACKNCPRRVKRIGHAVCIQSRLFP